MEITTHIIDTKELLNEFYEYISQYSNKNSLVALDVETDSSHPQLAKLYGIGISFEPNEGFYIPFKTPWGDDYWNWKQKEEIASFLSYGGTSRGYRYLMHNGVYDIIVLKKNLNIDLTDYLYCDTILLKHTLDEERPHGLKETAVKYLGAWADKAQEQLYENIKKNGGSVTKTNLQMFKADTDVLAEYCVWDVCLTRMLYDLLDPKLDEENLRFLFYEDEVMPLYKEVTIPMTDRGFPVDVAHFEKLKTEITKEIEDIEQKIQEQISELVEPLCISILDDEHPVKRTGGYPKKLAEMWNISLPIDPVTGKVTISKKKLKETLDPNSAYYKWLVDEDDSIEVPHRDVQLALFFDKNEDKNYVFNLKSNDHLSQLLFGILGEESVAETESGNPKIDENVLETFKDKYSWVSDLIDMKKLNKLEGTYISGILERQIGGVLYAGWLQIGTTSGRYSCTNPNLQNQPRIKDEDDTDISPLVLKYANKIKEGFIAGFGKKLVGADQSALEPRAFACASQEPLLQKVYTEGLDLYSTVAINTFGLNEYSADKKASNYLGKHKKEMRQLAKVFCLAAVYGASAKRLHKMMGMSVEETQKVIDSYFTSYPKLKQYMEDCTKSLLKEGKVISRFGRIRHLPRAKQLHDIYGQAVVDLSIARKKKLTEQYWELKNLRNLSTNHPIQSTAAYVINKAMIATSRKFKKESINAYICANVHDELTCLCDESDADRVKEILQDCMENTVKLEVPFIAEPSVGDRWSEAK